MAPEQLERPQEVDYRAEIYLLGVVFYKMLTGEFPIGRFAPPSHKTPMDPRLDGIVLRALEKEREKRYQSAGEVKTSVEHLAGAPGTPGPTRPIPAPDDDFVLCNSRLPRPLFRPTPIHRHPTLLSRRRAPSPRSAWQNISI